jgi:hypothetical protein
VELSDLVITGVRLSPVKPRTGQVVVVNVIVENRGNATARNVSLDLYRNGEALISRELGDLPAGGKHVESFVWIPRAGKNVLVFIVDPEDRVSESDETGNTAMVVKDLAPASAGANDETLLLVVSATMAVAVLSLAVWWLSKPRKRSTLSVRQ